MHRKSKPVKKQGRKVTGLRQFFAMAAGLPCKKKPRYSVLRLFLHGEITAGVDGMTEEVRKIDLGETDTQQGKFLTFFLGDEVFGIEIKYVTEIVGLQKINRLPEAPDFVKGIINLRGKIIPVIDMRLRFKKEETAYTDRTCIIVVEINDVTVGLIVDQVEEVANIADESIVPPPDLRMGFQNRFIKGIGKVKDGIRLLLDCERLFKEDEMETINRIDN